MPLGFFLTAFFFSAWHYALASKMPISDVFKDMPASYFGFHFMIPLDYHNAIPSSLLRELRIIFVDIRAKKDSLPYKSAQNKYNQIIDALVSKCENICKMKNLPLHRFLKVDEAFCATLRTKMLNWIEFMSFYIPKRDIFISIDHDSIKKMDVSEVELKMGEMANEILCMFEMQHSEYPAYATTMPITLHGMYYAHYPTWNVTSFGGHFSYFPVETRLAQNY